MSRAFSRVGASRRLRAPSDQSPIERNHFGARRVRERRNMGVGPESWEPALQAGHSAKLRRDRRRFRQKHDACIRKESVEYEPSRGRRERVCGPRRGHGQKARNSDLSQPRERYLLRLVSIPPSHGFLSAGGLAARARAKPRWPGNSMSSWFRSDERSKNPPVRGDRCPFQRQPAVGTLCCRLSDEPFDALQDQPACQTALRAAASCYRRLRSRAMSTLVLRLCTRYVR